MRTFEARFPGGRRPSRAPQVDWLLWQLGEQRKDAIPPHHRTLTTCY